MARPNRLTVLTLSFLFLLGTATAIQFEVDITGLTGQNTVKYNYTENVGTIQNITAIVENTGSIGCNYRLKADFNYKNTTDTQWSAPKALWPGETAVLDLQYVPYNYTGNVSTRLSLAYCGETTRLSNFTFKARKNISTQKNVETQLLKVEKESSRIKTGVEKGLMVPKDKPAKWKVSTVRIRNGEAELEYEPTLFNEKRTLEYYILDENRTVVGKTSISLNYEPGILQKAFRNKWKILLLASLLLNGLLLLKIMGFKDRIVETFKEKELPIHK
ncbi:MAG: hypothetical protein ABEJ83_03040 [Candidatus Nanohaloarchaea archaeon]